MPLSLNVELSGFMFRPPVDIVRVAAATAYAMDDQATARADNRIHREERAAGTDVTFLFRFKNFHGDITSDVDRFLNRPPLRHETLYGIRCREVHSFRKLFNV